MKKPAKDLLKNDDVRRWYENTKRGSKVNADIRLRRLNLFCHTTETTPSQLVNLGRRDIITIENVLFDHVSWLESKDYSPNYIEGIIKSIKSWLSYNYVYPRRNIRIANAGIPVRIQDEVVPTKETLKKILDVADTRTRTSISLMAFSGIRPQVMGNSDASDGLRVSDLADLVIDGSNVSFARIPAMITVRAALSKTRNKYITFLPEEGCQYVLGYLRKRIADGERIHQDSPIIALKQGYENKGRFQYKHSKIITTPRITADIRDAMWAVTKARPYVLRAYFDTQLLLAESNGKMTHAYRQFFMGHKGDIEARYTTNKGRLTDEMLSDMRRAFLQSEQYLCTNQSKEPSQQDKKEMFLEMWREQAKMYGIDPMKLRIEKQRDVDYIDVIRQEIMAKIRIATQDRQYQSRIVPINDELLSFIEGGWEPVKEISQNRIIIKKRE